jgi:hypothetical protein
MIENQVNTIKLIKDTKSENENIEEVKIEKKGFQKIKKLDSFNRPKSLSLKKGEPKKNTKLHIKKSNSINKSPKDETNEEIIIDENEEKLTLKSTNIVIDKKKHKSIMKNENTTVSEGSENSEKKIIVIPKFNLTRVQDISCKNIFLKKNVLYYKDFKSFLEKEHSVEYLLFYNDVNTYKNMSERSDFAAVIFEKYFTNDSKYEINTTNDEKEIIKSNLSSNKDDIFDHILNDVVGTSLKESMDRFKSNKKY